MVRMMAMPLSLSRTSMIMLEITLNAATRMISVRIRNITFRSTLRALKNCRLRLGHAEVRARPANVSASAVLTRSAASGSSSTTFATG